MGSIFRLMGFLPRMLSLFPSSGRAGDVTFRVSSACSTPQVESILGRERYEDDDREWADVSSQIVRSMTPAREKIWRAESEMWLNTRFCHRLSKEDFEAIFEIRGLEPNEWTGRFVEDLLPVKSKWRRW